MSHKKLKHLLQLGNPFFLKEILICFSSAPLTYYTLLNGSVSYYYPLLYIRLLQHRTMIILTEAFEKKSCWLTNLNKDLNKKCKLPLITYCSFALYFWKDNLVKNLSTILMYITFISIYINYYFIFNIRSLFIIYYHIIVIYLTQLHKC